MSGKAEQLAKDFLKAAFDGDAAAMQKCIDAGVDVETANERGTTAFHWIAHHDDYVETLPVLLGAGANIDVQDDNGMTPLHIAAERGDPRLVKLLLDAGADIEKNEKHGMTPLLKAASKGTAETVQAFIDAGADLTARDNGGSSALYCTVFDNHVDNARVLLEAEIDPQMEHESGNTALSYARFREQQGIVDLLEGWRGYVDTAEAKRERAQNDAFRQTIRAGLARRPKLSS